MRVLVTGATGFVGRWLMQELTAHGHVPIPAPPSRQLDLTDPVGFATFAKAARPEAIAHLAAISYAGDAARDLERAMLVNAGGTAGVINAASRAGGVPVLVSGSSEVYGTPSPHDLPLREDAPMRATLPYGRSKVAQEKVALETAAASGVPVVVTRSFNHTGPGQRPDFVAPALASRILALRDRGADTVAVGNLDVQRDIGDVRDVVRAYRLLLEGLAAGEIETGTVVNVATGTATAIRQLLDLLAEIVGIRVLPVVDPALVRPDDPPLVTGDPTRLRRLTAWHPEIPLSQTLSDLVEAMDSRSPR